MVVEEFVLSARIASSTPFWAILSSMWQPLRFPFAPMMALRSPQVPPRHLQDGSKTARRRSQEASRSPPRGLQEGFQSPRCSKRTQLDHLGPIGTHLGSILVPFWFHSGSRSLGPIWDPFWFYFGSIQVPVQVPIEVPTLVPVQVPIQVAFGIHFGRILVPFRFAFRFLFRF